jgi:release factor glutamine methyltransferase
MTSLVTALQAAGCLAAEDEAEQLREAAARLRRPVDELLERRTQGEPLAWITGRLEFAGIELEMAPGVYVPRPHTEWLALRAAELAAEAGAVVDLCTGGGAVAAVIGRRSPAADLWATDVDEAAVALAHRNGVRALIGDLDEPVAGDLAGRCRVVTCVPPYVPAAELELLPRDVREREPHTALVGGDADGLGTARRALAAAGRLLAPGGILLIEAGHAQCGPLAAAARASGLGQVAVHRDEDGDARAVVARWGAERAGFEPANEETPRYAISSRAP